MNKQEFINKLSGLNLIEKFYDKDLEKIFEDLFYNNEDNQWINIDKFYNFAKSRGLKDIEIVYFIKSNPRVLTEGGFNNFLRKYIFLSVIENDTNTRRIKHMKKSPKDFKVSLDKIYSRYYYMKDMELDIGWNSLLRNKQEKIDKKIIAKGEEPLTIKEIKELYPIDEEYLDEIKLLAINNFGEKHEKGRTR